MKKSKIVLFLSLSFLIFFLARCTKKPIHFYPEFPQIIQGINKAVLVADINVIDDIKGKIDQYDVLKNLEIGKNILNTYAQELNQHGFAVSKSLVSSVGILMKEKQYKVIRTSDQQQLDKDSLPVESSFPLYVDEDYYDVEKIETLRSFYRNLYQDTAKRGTLIAEHLVMKLPNKIIPESDLFETGEENEALFVILVNGYHRPTGKALVKGGLVFFLTGGLLYTTPHSSVTLFIIDTKTNQVTWADHLHTETSTDKGIFISAQTLIEACLKKILPVYADRQEEPIVAKVDEEPLDLEKKPLEREEEKVEIPAEQDLDIEAFNQQQYEQLKSLVDQYIQSFNNKYLLDFYRNTCSSELYQEIKKDTELIFAVYNDIKSAASNITIRFKENNQAEVRFSSITIGIPKSDERRQVIFEGIYVWDMEMYGDSWKIIGIAAHPTN
jgi:hypothetical protein